MAITTFGNIPILCPTKTLLPYLHKQPSQSPNTPNPTTAHPIPILPRLNFIYFHRHSHHSNNKTHTMPNLFQPRTTRYIHYQNIFPNSGRHHTIHLQIHPLRPFYTPSLFHHSTLTLIPILQQIPAADIHLQFELFVRQHIHAMTNIDILKEPYHN